MISCIGLALRWFIVGSVPADTSVRSTREQRADVLNTTGMYSAVRHPLYLANTIIVTGFATATGSLWFLALFLTSYGLCIERIIAAEEHFLANRHRRAWLAWAAQTATLVPNAGQWQSADLPFSVRTVLRREYNARSTWRLPILCLKPFAILRQTTNHSVLGCTTIRCGSSR